MNYDEIYSDKNSAGLGFGIGEEEDKIKDAARAMGWTVEETISICLIRCADKDGKEYLVGGDAVGRLPWAISL